MAKSPGVLDVEKVIRNTDWVHYGRSVDWRTQMPDCHFYDGEESRKIGFICPVWQNWLSRGRELYPAGGEGLSEYLTDLRETVPEGFRKMDHKRAEEFLNSR